MAILAIISAAFDNAIFESRHFQSLGRLKMAASAALRNHAAQCSSRMGCVQGSGSVLDFIPSNYCFHRLESLAFLQLHLNTRNPRR